MLEKGGWIQLSCEYPSVVVTRLAERCDVDVLKNDVHETLNKMERHLRMPIAIALHTSLFSKPFLAILCVLAVAGTLK